MKKYNTLELQQKDNEIYKRELTIQDMLKKHGRLELLYQRQKYNPEL